MKNRSKHALTALLLAGVVSTSLATNGIDLKVGGTINPSACTLTLSENGSIHYDQIWFDMLSEYDYTVLPIKTLDFDIQCNSQMKIAVKANDARTGSQAGTTAPNYLTPVRLLGSNQLSVMGLGFANGRPVGGYALEFYPFRVIADDLVNVNHIASVSSGRTWRLGNDFSTPGVWISWQRSGEPVIPTSFTTLAARLEIQAYINKKTELDLSRVIRLDGLANLELIYL